MPEHYLHLHKLYYSMQYVHFTQTFCIDTKQQIARTLQHSLKYDTSVVVKTTS